MDTLLRGDIREFDDLDFGTVFLATYPADSTRICLKAYFNEHGGNTPYFAPLIPGHPTMEPIPAIVDPAQIGGRPVLELHGTRLEFSNDRQHVHLGSGYNPNPGDAFAFQNGSYLCVSMGGNGSFLANLETGELVTVPPRHLYARISHWRIIQSVETDFVVLGSYG